MCYCRKQELQGSGWYVRRHSENGVNSALGPTLGRKSLLVDVTAKVKATNPISAFFIQFENLYFVEEINFNMIIGREIACVDCLAP